MLRHFTLAIALFTASIGCGNEILESAEAYSIEEMLPSPEKKAAFNVEVLNDSNFSSKIAQGAAIIDYYTTWCGPCQMFAPVFAKVAKKKAGKIAFYKVNIEDCPKAASANKIRAIPTIILYFNGQEVARKTGGLTESQLIHFIESNINH